MLPPTTLMEEYYEQPSELANQLKFFFAELATFIINTLHLSFLRMEERKGVMVTALYRQRGKMARQLMHSGMAGLAAVGMMIAPVIAQEFPGRNVNPWDIPSASAVLSAPTDAP